MKRFVSMAAALAFVSALACGETAEIGSISGTVTDSSGATIENASVTTDPVTVTATTAADGTYTLADLDAGTYKVIVTADGYLVTELTGIEVIAGETATADATLEPAVSGGAVAVNVINTCTGTALEGADVVIDGGNAQATGADGSLTVTELEAGDHTVQVSSFGFLPVETTVTVTEGTEVPANVELTCQTKAVGDVARDFMATVQGGFTPITKAQVLFDNLNDGNAENDPVVVSVRGADHYELGHIPGAVNMGWKAVASDAAIDLFGAPGTDTEYVAYCYTGHTGGIATTIMNLLGYKTSNLKYGIGAWTADTSVSIYAPFDDSVDSNMFDTEATVNEATGDFEPPVLAFDGVEDAWEATKAASEAYLGREGMKPTISATALHDLLMDGDDSNDPFIISVRSPDHYALGHIPGAINIPWKNIADEANLRKIPTDRKIVVYCYTGHTGAIATGVLGALGYDASNLKFGIYSWTTDETVRALGAYHGENGLHDFDVNTGANP